MHAFFTGRGFRKADFGFQETAFVGLLLEHDRHELKC